MLGFPLYLNPSMLLLAALVTLIVRPVRAAAAGPVRRPPATSSVGFVVCLLASVLLHELGHALTARRFGIGVRGITLELLGGYTEMDRDAPEPPGRPAGVAGRAGRVAGARRRGRAGRGRCCRTARWPTSSPSSSPPATSSSPCSTSLPGLPLDGGRALRAGVWAITKDRHRGTEVAGWVGRGGRGRAPRWPSCSAVPAGICSPLFGLVFMLLVALTLWQGAGQAIRLARMTRRFPLVDLRALARPVFAGADRHPAGRGAAAARRGRRPSARAGRGRPSGRLVALVDDGGRAAVPASGGRGWRSTPSPAPWTRLPALAGRPRPARR